METLGFRIRMKIKAAKARELVKEEARKKLRNERLRAFFLEEIVYNINIDIQEEREKEIQDMKDRIEEAKKKVVVMKQEIKLQFYCKADLQKGSSRSCSFKGDYNDQNCVISKYLFIIKIFFKFNFTNFV
jgi:hypothetical protein